MKKRERRNLPVTFALLALLLMGMSSCEQPTLENHGNTDSGMNAFAAYDHTALVVKNLDSSLAFYQRVFDFDTIHYPFPYRENIRAKWMSMGPQVELHLGEFKGDTTHYNYPGHLGIWVRSLDTLFSRLSEIGYQLPELAKMPNGERTVHIKDLDGHPIHIIERK